MTVSARDVLQLLDVLASVGVQRVWIDGGWGVDALLGQQTRLHQDLDLVIEERDLPAARTGLQAVSFVEVGGGRAWNFVMVDRQDRRVDLHAVRLAADGTGLYGPDGDAYPAGSLTGCGSIDGHPVRCLTAGYQVESHTGYDHDEDDVHDVMALHRRFGIPLPGRYVGDGGAG